MAAVSPELARGPAGPGGPAKACAIDSHWRATGPSAATAVSCRCRRWVTSRQKSSAGPVTRSAAPAGPQVHTAPDGATSSTLTGSAGASSWCAA